MVDIFRRVKEVKGGILEESRSFFCSGFSGIRFRLFFEFLVFGREVVFRDSFSVVEVSVFEFGYVNYIKLYYVLGFSEGTELEDGERGVRV